MGKAVAVARCRHKDGQHLLRVFAEIRPELTHSLLRLLGSAEDAQDAVQECFLKCWRGAAGSGKYATSVPGSSASG